MNIWLIDPFRSRPLTLLQVEQNFNEESGCVADDNDDCTGIRCCFDVFAVVAFVDFADWSVARIVTPRQVAHVIVLNASGVFRMGKCFERYLISFLQPPPCGPFDNPHDPMQSSILIGCCFRV